MHVCVRICACMCGSGEVRGGRGVGYCWLKEEAMTHVGWGRGRLGSLFR